MKTQRTRAWWGAAVLVVLLASAGSAQSLPSVNLGFTSFLDGGPPAGPGFYFQEYIQYYTADEFKDDDGDDVALPHDPDLEVWASLNQFIYQSDQALLLGGKWGIDVIVPVVWTDLEPGSLPIEDNGAGLGDLLIGPFLQWDPIMGQQGPIFMHRIEFQNLIPTGKYDDDHLINPGSGFYSFNPYWAATLFVLPQWTVTCRVHYLWNDANDDPYETFYPDADDTQAGQAMHLNFASSIEILPKRLRAGVNGYYLAQFTDSEVDGHSMDDTREEVLGIGPGAVYHFSQNDHLFFNTYFETLVRNRPEGMKFILRWTHHF